MVLPTHLQRKLELPGIVGRRRLARAASGPSSGIAQLIHRSHVEPVRKIEAVGYHIELQMLSEVESSREPQIELVESRGHKRIAPQIAIASKRRRDSRHAERLPPGGQARRRHHKGLAGNKG